jgi:hypothetical protein
MVEIRPAVQEDDRLSLADFAIIQLSVFDRDSAFTWRRRVRREIGAHCRTFESRWWLLHRHFGMEASSAQT